MISVSIAEDERLLASAVEALLALEPDIRVVSVDYSARDAIRRVAELRPDILLADIGMPDGTGLDVAAELRRRAVPTKVIIVTTFDRPGYLRRALDLDVNGYLLKDRPISMLVAAIRKVHAGGRAIDPELALDAWSAHDPLNDRQREILRLVGEGLESSLIAARLGLSDGTVRNYLSDAIQKTGTKNRIEAARIARDRGWL